MRILVYPVTLSTLLACLLLLTTTTAADGANRAKVLPSVSERFVDAAVDEKPSFQKHVVPLFGRLGCNGRACHGSFQGQGGFQLSLFGYDFKADHAALLDVDSPRVEAGAPEESLILSKPTDADMHDGGKRYDKGSWQYHLFRRWIEEGAEFSEEHVQKIRELEVSPTEIIFDDSGETTRLRAIAVWEDGTREDVTCLSRFRSNDEQAAVVDQDGLVTAKDRGDTHVVVFYDNAVVPIPVIRPVSQLAGSDYPSVPAPTAIDRHIVAKLRKLGIVPSQLTSDEEFLRRVGLDMTGTLPTPTEVVDFLADRREDKRRRKIDELLETDAYAAWWTTQLCDYTGNNNTMLVNVGPVRGRESQDWYDWIYRRVSENSPYDELAAGIVLAKSRKPGQSYTDYCAEMSAVYRGEEGKSFADRAYMPHYWARRNLRQAEEKAIAFAYSFLGIRIQCAQCHKHPFDQWSKQDFDDFKSFFSRVAFANTASRDARGEYNQIIKSLGLKDTGGGQLRRELTKLFQQGKTVPFSEVYTSSTGSTAKILGGDEVQLDDFDDPREPLMDWLRDSENPYFARAFVNRAWANYFGRGIVHPPDDMSLANPPSNKPLLDYLTQGFIDSGYDMQWLHREITNSRTYQLSWVPNETNQWDERNFSRCLPRRLPAELVYDAVRQATAAEEALVSPRSDVPNRAIALAGASSQAGNGGAQYALSVFGRSTRESNCDCDRSTEANLLQTVYLQNDRDLLAALVRKDGWLAELGGQLKPAAAKSGESIDALRSRQSRLNKQREALKLKVLRSSRSTPKKQLAQLRKQLDRVTKQWEDARKQLGEAEASQTPLTKLDTDALVQQAYLRTLSRLPDERERGIARDYIEQAEQPVDGIRAVLWALLNTKEFIVNH